MNTKIFTLAITLFLFSGSIFSQKYLTKNGHIKFFSETPAESIEAHNNQVNSVLDISNGGFAFKVLIKSFEFKKALMQEHFNENYLESDKYPSSTFTGKVEDISSIDFSKNGEYDVVVKGKLTIHNVTKEIEEKGKLKVEGNSIKATSVMNVKVADYDIKIAKAVTENIAENIEVTIEVDLQKM